MGMDAYAVDHEGHRLPTRPVQGCFLGELVNADQLRTFSRGAYILSHDPMTQGKIDADFAVGGLNISAYASAVNHLMFWNGQSPECDDAFSPEQVRLVYPKMNDIPKGMPEYVANDGPALAHARAFIACCAELGLGIEISL